tara:strand:- start:385 stop:579 length:195 start_codon:yes stop_codon:yes gene_type:complete
MYKISEIDLGSSLLSIVIVAGFIATAFAVIRVAIIGINYTKENYLKKEAGIEKKEEINDKPKGF